MRQARTLTHTKKGMFLLAGVALFGGCLEYETTTQVRPDGSLKRSIVVSGDSSGVYGWKFNIPADSTWTILKREKLDEKKWKMTAEKEFASAGEWNAYQSGIDRRTIACTVKVEKTFKLFTTTYRYSETVSSYNPFRLIPLTDYLSPSELQAFLRFEVLKESYPTRGDSLALDDAGDRFEEWEKECRVEAYYRALVRHLEGGDSARLASLRTDLTVFFTDEGKDEKNSSKEPETEELMKLVRKQRWTELTRAAENSREELDRLKRDVDYVASVGRDTYESRLEMPGTIVSTNGRRTDGETVLWKDYIAYAYVADFTMEAESSVVNVWAIVLGLAVLVGAPMLVWVAKKLRQVG